MTIHDAVWYITRTNIGAVKAVINVAASVYAYRLAPHAAIRLGTIAKVVRPAVARTVATLAIFAAAINA